MKIKSILLTLIVTLSLFSCKEDDRQPQYSLSVTPTSLQFLSSGNTAQTITVTSENMTWNASVGQSGTDWITIECSETSITVNVTDNEALEPREGEIIIVPEISDVEPVSVTVVQAAKEAPDAEQLSPEGSITYYAQNFTYSTNGTDEWLINLFTSDSDYELYWADFGKDGYWSYSITNGSLISLYLYNTPAEDFFNADISDGTYTACYDIGTMEPMTMLTSTYYSGTPWPQGSFIANYSNGSATYSDITDGEVTLEHNGSEYNIYMVLTLSDGSKVAYEFSGKLESCTLGNPPYYSDLTEDLDITNDDIAQCAITASYSNLNNEGITEWVIEFLGEDLNVDDMGAVSGNGYYVAAHLFAPESTTGTIPDGEYTINVLDAYSNIDAYSAMIGTYNPIMGNSGCYIDIYDGDNLDFAPMSGGTIKVTYLENDNYRFEFNAMDDNNHNITISYEGYVKRADQY